MASKCVKHKPRRAISLQTSCSTQLHRGGGFFAHFALLPCSLAWESFQEKNGASSLQEMRESIEGYRRLPASGRQDYQIGCIILTEAFFLDEHDWIPDPDDFAKNIARGKGYDTAAGTGAQVWSAIQRRLAALAVPQIAESEKPMYGEPVPTRLRLGQGSVWETSVTPRCFR